MLDIDKLLELESNVSSAPWQCFIDMEPGLKIDWPRGYMTSRDIEFVSLMRNNIRPLLEELKMLREKVRMLENEGR